MINRCLILVTASMLVASCGGTDGSSSSRPDTTMYRTHLNPDGTLGIVNRPPPANYSKTIDPEKGLPPYDASSESPFPVDVRSADLRKLDLLDREEDLRHATFDSKTRWPIDLPAGFDPNSIMELGKNPGLGIRALHAAGVTGKGVGIAIIDQGLLVDHVEYRDRIRSYEEIHLGDRVAQMHGPAVSSIAVGKSVGVAPEADLYYIGETHGVFTFSGFEWDLTYLADSIDRIGAINATLPAGKKIRVLSISLGVTSNLVNGDLALAAIERAEEQGIYVVHCASPIGGLSRDPMSDPDDVASYGSSRLSIDSPADTTLLVPMDARSTASPTGTSDYVFYPEGGLSWTSPYVAGLYALACQVNPEVTPAMFRETVVATATSVPLSYVGVPYAGIIANPARLIDALRQ